eukprot:CAMPEP_0172459432 /NCGR_PEP_ID=MMETSP1065-20121228/32587_1 /TAXON_ID=265537 /ORGANISM="Amphiprora paludosa, Strain CCMP125" /LENGTH=464 /DNA_ID=CAMNT_0013214109 /DNA_START=27 /DNA_END=1421 /DNA_ORIENTATION=-
MMLSSISAWSLTLVLVSLPSPSTAFVVQTTSRSTRPPLSSLFASVQEAQATVSLDRSTARDFGSYQEWAVQCGVQVNPDTGFCFLDQMVDDNPEQYAATSTGTSAGSVIMMVPGEMVLSSNRLQQELQPYVDDQCFQVLQQANQMHMGAQFLLFLKVMLEYEAGSQSPYFPWLNAMPRQWNTAVAMTDFCMSCLPPYLKQVCNGERDQFAAFSQAVQSFDHLSPSAKNNQDLLQFAYNIVMTRAVFDQNSQDWKLVPVADMMNHGHDANAQILHDPESGACQVQTTRDVQPGEALKLQYGYFYNLDPSKCLAQYGFLDENAPTTYCKLVFDNPSPELLEIGYANGPATMLLECETGEIAEPVWDVLLYSILEQEQPDVAQTFFQATLQGDVATKQDIHQMYWGQTSQALLRHVKKVLTQVNDLKVQMNTCDPKKHPRLPLLRRHHIMVLDTFLNVQEKLQQMMG